MDARLALVGLNNENKKSLCLWCFPCSLKIYVAKVSASFIFNASGLRNDYVCWPVESFDSPSNCTSIRLDQGNGPFAKLPVYHQALGTDQDTNLCYAITAAQLIDAYRIQGGDQRENLTSPLSIASAHD